VCCLVGEASSLTADKKVPVKATRLYRWIVIDRRWKRNDVSRPSPLMVEICRPISLMKSQAEGLIGPKVIIIIIIIIPHNNITYSIKLQ